MSLAIESRQTCNGQEMSELTSQEPGDGRFRAAFENAAVGMAQVSLDGRFLHVNERLCEITGYTRQELQAKRFQDITHPDDLDPDIFQLRRVLSGQTDSYSMDKRYLRKDGEAVWVKLTVGAVRDPAGAVDYLVSVIEDISERKRAEKDLRESEERFRTLADNISQLAWIADSSGWVTWYNKRWYAYTGTAFEDVAGWGWVKVHHPKHVDRVVARISESFRTGEAWEDTFPLRGRDGQFRWFLSRAMPIRDESGAAIRWFGTSTDVTERREAELSDQLLAAVVESSEDAILTKDLNGVITSWNRGAQQLFGYSAEEVIGKPITILFPEDRLDEEIAILDRIRRGERIADYETVRRRKDGSLLIISLTVSPVKNPEGEVVAISKIARDITERRRTEEQKDLIVREMGHRVKNLLTVASSIVALSAKGAQSPEALARSAQERLAALGRAQDLTLAVSARSGQYHSQPATLHALISTVLKPFETQDGGAPRVLIRGADIPVGVASVTSIALLLHEFATNAAKYGALSSPGGRIEIDCNDADGQFELQWVERGAPVEEKAACSEGFGDFLVRATVEHQLRGKIEREWKADGISIRLVFPTNRLSA